MIAKHCTLMFECDYFFQNRSYANKSQILVNFAKYVTNWRDPSPHLRKNKTVQYCSDTSRW